MKRNGFPSTIIFIGPEASGKSTLMGILGNWFESKNLKVKKTHIVEKHIFAYLLVKILILLGKYDYWNYPSGERKKILDPTFEKRIIGLWLCTQALSVIVTVLFRVYLWLWLGYIVLAERYIPDSFIHLLAKARNYGLTGSFGMKPIYFLLRFIPKDSFIILLDCDYTILKQRYESRGSQTEPKFYISGYVKSYPTLIHSMSSFSHTYLYLDNARKSIAKTFEEIKSKLIVWQQESARTNTL